MWEFSSKGESRRRSVKAAEMGECKRPGLATDSGESSNGAATATAGVTRAAAAATEASWQQRRAIEVGDATG